MCEMTQIYYSCGCVNGFVVKEPRCRYYPNCHTTQAADTHLTYPCHNHRQGNTGGNSSTSRTGGGRTGGGNTGGRTGGGHTSGRTGGGRTGGGRTGGGRSGR